MKNRGTLRPLVVLAAIALAACQQGPTAAQREAAARQQAAAQRAAQAQQELNLYREMLARKDLQLAASMGRQIRQMYPGTPAAAEVDKSLPAVAARAAKQAERQRLAALWNYQTGVPMEGGTQNTATIYDTRGDGSQGRIQLVLRRHSQWGQSVYLYGQAPGFVCAGLCRLPIAVDGGRPHDWSAYLPPSGEPALFIKDDARFIAMLEKARTLAVTVHLRYGGTRTLKYEVAGFKPRDFPALARH